MEGEQLKAISSKRKAGLWLRSTGACVLVVFAISATIFPMIFFISTIALEDEDEHTGSSTLSSLRTKTSSLALKEPPLSLSLSDYGHNKSQSFPKSLPSKSHLPNKEPELHQKQQQQRTNPDEIYESLMLWRKDIENETYKLLPNYVTSTTTMDAGILVHSPSANDDVVLVTHLEMSQINHLVFLLRQWTGPASVAVYLSSRNDIIAFVDFYRFQQENHSLIISPSDKEQDANNNSRTISFHIMVEKTNRTLETRYPRNILKEMALQEGVLDGCSFLLVDVDIVVPSMDYYPRLRELFRTTTTIKKKRNSPPTHRILQQGDDDNVPGSMNLFVLPTFDWHHHRGVDYNFTDAPEHESITISRKEAIKMLHDHTMEAFHFDDCHRNCRAVDDYDNWMGLINDNDVSYEIDYEYKFQSYVVGIKTPSLPHFWPDFRGSGRDLMPWFQEAHCIGYRFSVLRDFFLLHLGNYTEGNATTSISRHNMNNFHAFQLHLNASYFDPSNPQRCEIDRAFLREFPADRVEANLAKHWTLLEPDMTDAIPNIFPRTQSLVHNDNEIVLVTHASLDTTAPLLRTLRQWNGPAEIAFHLPYPGAIQIFMNFYIDVVWPDIFLQSQTSWHILLDKTPYEKLDYPYNKLRELALEQVPYGVFFLQMDVDTFVPSSINTRVQLQRTLSSFMAAAEGGQDEIISTSINTTFFVLPSLDIRLLPTLTDHDLGHLLSNLTKEDIVSGSTPTDDGTTIVHHGIPISVEKSRSSIRAVNYDQWLTAKGANDPHYYWIDYEFPFEPYVVGKRSVELPQFWQKLRGHGRNRYMHFWFQEAHCAGFHFVVLNDFFVLHVVDDDTIGKSSAYGDDPTEHRLRNQYQLGYFQQYLRGRYVANATTANTQCHIQEQYLHEINATATPMQTTVLSNDPREMLFERWRQLEFDTFELLPSVYSRGDPLEEDDIVLITHMGITRTARLLFSLELWTGPSGISVYVSSPEEIELFLSFYETYIEPNEMLRSKTTLHVMLEKTEPKEQNYPHNILREMALQQVPDGKCFLQLDADIIVPSTDTYNQLRTLIRTDTKVKEVLASLTTLFVIPTFDTSRKVRDHKLRDQPRNLTKEDILRMCDEGEIFPFHVHDARAAYRATNYIEWLGRNSSDPNNNTICLSFPVKTPARNHTPVAESFYWTEYEYMFEPYILGVKSAELPHFWQKFRGFGRDKLSWFQEANCMGIRFAVFRDFFLLHLAHRKIKLNPQQRGAQNRDKFRYFQFYLTQQYANSTQCYVKEREMPE